MSNPALEAARAAVATEAKALLALAERLGCRALAVNATAMAVEVLGKPIPNTALLAAFLALTEHVPQTALAAALMHATLQIVLRYLGRFERPETVTFYFLVIGTVVTALPLPLVAVTPSLNELPLLFGVGLSGALAQWLISTAFRNARAAIVTVFNYSGIVWATLFGWMIWDEWPLPTVLIGAGIVLGLAMYLDLAGPLVVRELRLKIGPPKGMTRAEQLRRLLLTQRVRDRQVRLLNGRVLRRALA